MELVLATGVVLPPNVVDGGPVWARRTAPDVRRSLVDPEVAHVRHDPREYFVRPAEPADCRLAVEPITIAVAELAVAVSIIAVEVLTHVAAFAQCSAAAPVPDVFDECLELGLVEFGCRYG